MVILENIVRRILQEQIEHPMRLLENVRVSDKLKYHLDNGITLSENNFKIYSKSYFDLINEVRELFIDGLIDLNENDIKIIETDLGKSVILENGQEVYLDVPMIDDEFLNEAEYQGRKVQVGRPMRNSGGGKKYVVYVKNPSTGKIKKISFGDVSGGLTAKVSNAKARKAFASRHQCEKKKDRMTAGYWACRINRYGHLWGGKTYPGFW